MNKGIFLVANFKSQSMCENLIYSIRESGCQLPIRLIHYGGREINSSFVLNEVEFLRFEDFPNEAKLFIYKLHNVLNECSLGFLYRFLAWFSDWDEFIYSDNDVVALCNWNDMFEYLKGYDLVHADEEYTTKGIFNYKEPSKIVEIFGENALESAMTAGHIVVKKKHNMLDDFSEALEWIKLNPQIPQLHDQALLHIASLLGKWKLLNLCKCKDWLSSWAGDYKNSLQLIQAVQSNNSKISHLHYSGGNPKGNLAIQDLLFSTDGDIERLKKLTLVGLKDFSGFSLFLDFYLRGKRYLKKKIRKSFL